MVNGNVMLGNQPFRLEEKEQGSVTFTEIRPEGGLGESHPAGLRPDGSFTLAGYNRQGIPPGKYRVSLSVRFADPDHPRIDLRKFGPGNSPWVVEVSNGMEPPSLVIR